MTTLQRILTSRWLRYTFAAWAVIAASICVTVLAVGGPVWVLCPFAAGSLLTAATAGILHEHARRQR